MKAGFRTILVLAGTLCGLTPLFGQDARAVAPDVFTVLLDNERVRVLEQRLKKGQREPMHSHPAYLKYTLSSYKGTSSYLNGQTSTVRQITKGQTMWFEAETHSQKNVGTTETHAIFVELRGVPVVQRDAAELANDPLTTDPRTHTRVLENDRVRVIEFRIKPGEATAMHRHRDAVFYILKGGTIQETLSGNTSHDVKLNDGEAKWMEAKSHKVKNTGTTEVRILIVELKG